MLVHVTGQMGGRTLILILRQVPATFTGQKLHRKIGLIFLYFSINLLFFWAEMSFCQVLPHPHHSLNCFAAPAPQFAEVTIFLDFLNLQELLQASPKYKKIKKNTACRQITGLCTV